MWDIALINGMKNLVKIFKENIMEIERFTVLANLDKKDYDEEGKERYTIVPEHEANLITSKVKSLYGNRHAPVLDIDVPHKLVPSSTEGHAHLYIDVECDWSDYVAFLRAAVKIGLIEYGYAEASITKGFSAVRKPGVTKIVK